MCGGGGLVSKLCLTLCNPTDCSLPGSSVHGTFQVRILEWVAISFSRGSAWSGIKPASPSLWGGFFTDLVTRTLICVCVYACGCVFELNLTRSLYMIKCFKKGLKVFQIIVTNYIGWQNSDNRKRSPDLKKKKKKNLVNMSYVNYSTFYITLGGSYCQIQTEIEESRENH